MSGRITLRTPSGAVSEPVPFDIGGGESNRLAITVPLDAFTIELDETGTRAHLIIRPLADS
jgi:hypothetical protein